MQQRVRFVQTAGGRTAAPAPAPRKVNRPPYVQIIAPTAWTTPWGDRDQAAITADAEAALERQLSTIIIRGGARPRIRKLERGATLTEQGDAGTEVYLVLDGMLIAEVDGNPVAEIGPGAILGERALLEGGTRTATLLATTACKVAVARSDQLDRDALAELSAGHRREEPPPGPPE